MKRFVFEKPNQGNIEDVDPPRLTSDKDVIIDVKGIGLCGTDMHIFRGERKASFPHVSGHECVGEVRETGDLVTRVQPGDLVTIEPNFSCMVCTTCLSGHKNLCSSKKTMGLNIPGCFSEMIKVNENYVWKLPENISVEEGTLIETATVALSGIKKANIKVGEKVLILGAGCIGLMAMQLAKLSGAYVCMADKNQLKLDCSVQMGADKVCFVSKEQLPEKYYDVVIDAAGSPATISATTNYVKPAGRIILIGVPSSKIEMDVYNIVRQELSIYGSVACVTEFPNVIELVAKGVLNVKDLVSHRLNMEEIVRGFELMEEGKALKPVVLL